MPLSFKYLLHIVENEPIFWNIDTHRERGGFRWKGPHFPVLVRYVLSLRFHNHERFSDLLMRVEKSARLCLQTKGYKQIHQIEEFTEMMGPFLPELGEFFAVPKAQQLLSDTTPKRNEVLAAFINFLVEVVEAFLSQKYLSRDITTWIGALLEDLKFLLLILGAEVEETKKTNILAEIESIANQTGLFVHSFFFTTRDVEDPKIVAATSDLLLEFRMTAETIKQYCILPSLTVSPTRDTQRLRMALSFKYLLQIVEGETSFLGTDLVQKRGGFHWKGPHFSVFVRYILNLPFYSNHGRFSDLQKKVQESAYLYWKNKNLLRHINWVKFLQAMDSFLPELQQFFTVPTPHQLLSGTTPKRNELVATFINFLVKAFRKISVHKYPFTSEIDDLIDKLKFILFILGDTPFQCAEVEETVNILTDIESIANQAGFFLHTFFFTTDRIEHSEILAALSDLLPKFKETKEKIKKHCIVFSNLPSVTTPNSALVSVFIVDYVLDYLTHLINKEARLIAGIKDQIATFCEELQLSRSFLGDIEVKQDLIKQAVQLRDLAYEAEYIITLYVTRDLPTWYTTLRLSNFIQKNKLITTAIQETRLNYGINCLQVAESRHHLSSHVPNIIQIDEEIIVGLNNETMQITSQLVGGPDHLQMISITGMPGLGKTTLAKKLYNHLPIVNYFDQRLWCVVSQTYQRTRLLRDILSSIPKLKEDKFLEREREDSELGEYLYKSLKGRRYLIVMDDIWDVQAWNDVKIYFPKDNARSRVLFTTRNRHLATEASSNAIINELCLHSPTKCWDLLQQKVFRKSIFHPELEHIGKQIAASCKGLPLAVVGVGAVLANTDMNESSWQQVSESLTSYISKDQDILELSYKHLPIHLKPCFLYFSAFEQGREISVKKLLSLWISEGFIPANKEKRLEEIAEKYLIELINRNMVQVAKRRSDKGVKACKVHDLMHDMALRIAGQKKFLRVIEDGFALYEQHHRLCNQYYSCDAESRLFGLHIRSLLGNSMSSFSAPHLRLVRVLQCKDSKIRHSVHLRYLQIQHMFISRLKTKNLEFLILTEETDIYPSFFCDAPKLRQLEFKHHSSFCKHMEFSQHNCLETLSGVRLDDSTDEDILRYFPNLRRLKCYSRNHCPDVSFLTHLESLNMIFDSSEVNIRAINFATNIKKLSLRGGYFEIMSSFGKLPNLEILKLARLDIKEENWNTNNDEFQKLKFLKLSNLYLRNWITSDSEDDFPMLEQLVLENCRYLNGIPMELGYISTLQMIKVHNCRESVEESALKIQKTQQEECGNEEMQVIINGYTHSS